MVDVISVHPGHYFTMVKLADGKIKGFGRNYSGELGYGNNNQYFYSAADKVPAVDVGNSGIISQVSSGGSHICILDSALFLSQVKCWGLNNMGQLGLGDINNRGNSLTTIPSKIEYVKNPAGITPIQIACGGSSTCILYNDNSVRCFGHGNSRGYSTTKDLTPDLIPGLDFGTNFIPKSITSGSAADHTCAISTNNNLKTNRMAVNMSMDLMKDIHYDHFSWEYIYWICKRAHIDWIFWVGYLMIKYKLLIRSYLNRI